MGWELIKSFSLLKKSPKQAVSIRRPPAVANNPDKNREPRGGIRVRGESRKIMKRKEKQPVHLGVKQCYEPRCRMARPRKLSTPPSRGNGKDTPAPRKRINDAMYLCARPLHIGSGPIQWRGKNAEISSKGRPGCRLSRLRVGRGDIYTLS
jgi:hypothetical protein